MQEILVILAIGLAVLVIPRMMNRNVTSNAQRPLRFVSGPQSIAAFLKGGLPGWMRLLIVLSILWIGGCALYFKPWEQDSLFFFSVGLGPVVAVWGGIWVWAGYRKYRR
jgi:hypothetical protein